MSRKKIIEEELYEDEKIIPAEENNCFAFDGKCQCLNANKMSKKDKVNCGTIKCPFYKPKEHANSVKYVSKDGISFETHEDFFARTGIKMIKIENLKDYTSYPHATEDELNRAYFDYIRKTRRFKLLTDKELVLYGEYIGVPTDNMSKEELVDVFNQIA